MRTKIIKPLLIFIVIILSVSCGTKSELSKDAPYKNPALSVKERTDDLLKRMTLNEKIGQMIQVERSVCDNPQVLTEYWIGSVLSGGGSAPIPNKPEEWARMYDQLQSFALKTRLGIPIIYGIDAVHGNNNVYGAVIFPHHIGMGATNDPEIVEASAATTASEVAGTGIDWTFSPCIAAPQDERWGRTYEGFSEHTPLTGLLGAAEIRGLQKVPAGNPGSDSGKTGINILACAKHFAGDGGTAGGKDQGDTRTDEQTFRKVHIAQYKKAIEADVGSVMVSFSSFNGDKMHGSKHFISDVLKGELGFNGFVVSDWMGINQIDPSFTECVKRSVNAGIDMIMVPYEFKKCFLAIKGLVEKKEIPQERIDDAARRIITAKFRLGVFEHPFTDSRLTKEIGSQAHRNVARDAVRKSIVLLKNSNNILPLSKNIPRLLVAGKAANDIGIQCGGWTITWQGSPGNTTIGTTILDGIKQTVSSDTKVDYSVDGYSTGSYNAAIVVIGELPYAEMYGDEASLGISTIDADMIAGISRRGIPVIVVIVSGRPLIITNFIGIWNAALAAWLPGSEGTGLADVIFGDYKPTGKLSYTWPKSMEQISINYGNAKYDPLFPFGFGLTY
jgi:beta-glucosidase